MTEGKTFGDTYYKVWHWIALGVFIVFFLNFVFIFVTHLTKDLIKDILVPFFIGAVYGLGVVMSGLARISKIRGFLTVGNGLWDPSIFFVFLTVIVMNTIFFHLIHRRGHPFYHEHGNREYQFNEEDWEHKAPDSRILSGAALFGVGFGLGGMDPTTGILNFFVLTHALFWVIGIVIGHWVHDWFLKEDKHHHEFSEGLLS
jgi:hypothetical protein